MITIKSKGDYSKTFSFLEQARKGFNFDFLEDYGKIGVEALAHATPVDTGLTSKSWVYKIEHKKGRVTLSFYNTNIQNGVSIALILQYGHGTRHGGWVEGRDYINPAIQPVFDELAARAWKEVKDL